MTLGSDYNCLSKYIFNSKNRLLSQVVLTPAQQQPLTSLYVTIFRSHAWSNKRLKDDMSDWLIATQIKNITKAEKIFFQLVGKPWLMTMFDDKTFYINLILGKMMSTKVYFQTWNPVQNSLRSILSLQSFQFFH